MRKWAFPKNQLWTLFHAYAVTHRLKKAMRNNIEYGIPQSIRIPILQSNVARSPSTLYYAGMLLSRYICSDRVVLNDLTNIEVPDC